MLNTESFLPVCRDLNRLLAVEANGPSFASLSFYEDEH